MEIFRGETKSWTIGPVLDKDDQAIDLTNRDLEFLVKLAQDDADDEAVISKAVNTGITITNGPAGLASLLVDDSDTDIDAIPKVFCKAYWWLRLIS